MKALSLWQPWAELVISGVKDVENRVWPTRHRGPLLIHASKRFDHDWLTWNCVNAMPIAMLLRCQGELPQGVLVGVVEVTDCMEPRWRRHAWHAAGQYGWYLKDARRFREPIPYRGRQRLFNVPDDVVAEQLQQVEAGG